jgi:hypothetical protein
VEDRCKREWYALFNGPWRDIARFRAYLAGEAELATHQVVKGSEYRHVMVVMDDEEAGGTLFSYDKLFGAEELGTTDRNCIDEGNETILNGTLRLLYVACSRAEESLALILSARSPRAALGANEQSGWFAADEVIAMTQLRLDTSKSPLECSHESRGAKIPELRQARVIGLRIRASPPRRALPARNPALLRFATDLATSHCVRHAQYVLCNCDPTRPSPTTLLERYSYFADASYNGGQHCTLRVGVSLERYGDCAFAWSASGRSPLLRCECRQSDS